jgi:hypothetical protein
MPQVEFDSGFKKKGFNDFNKLSLESNEKARICVLESPWMEYVHTIRRVITLDGKPVMKTESFPQKGGGTREREVPDTDYVGKFICLGDPDALETNSVDIDNCPACKLSTETSAVEGPKRRFAVHVIKYQVKKGTFNVQSPFQVELLAWEFSDRRFNTLVDIQTELEQKLSMVDLCLGPCENKTYQKFDIIPGQKAEWRQSEERQAVTKDVVKSQRYPDLTPLMGRKVSFAELKSQCVDVVQAWNLAFGVPGGLPVSDTEKAVEDAQKPYQGEADAVGGLDLFASDEAPAPSESPSTDEDSKSEEEMSLEDLLGIEIK